MYTFTRCFFGDCTTQDGRPLLEQASLALSSSQRIIARFTNTLFLVGVFLWIPSAVGAVLTARLTNNLASKSRMKRKDFRQEARTVVDAFDELIQEFRRVYEVCTKQPQGA